MLRENARRSKKTIIDGHARELTDARAKAVDEYHQKIKQSVAEKQSRARWWWDFTVTGLAGVWASLIVVVMVFGGSILLVSEETRAAVREQAVEKLKSLIN